MYRTGYNKIPGIQDSITMPITRVSASHLCSKVLSNSHSFHKHSSIDIHTHIHLYVYVYLYIYALFLLTDFTKHFI